MPERQLGCEKQAARRVLAFHRLMLEFFECQDRVIVFTLILINMALKDDWSVVFRVAFFRKAEFTQCIEILALVKGIQPTVKPRRSVKRICRLEFNARDFILSQWHMQVFDNL